VGGKPPINVGGKLVFDRKLLEMKGSGVRGGGLERVEFQHILEMTRVGVVLSFLLLESTFVLEEGGREGGGRGGEGERWGGVGLTELGLDVAISPVN